MKFHGEKDQKWQQMYQIRELKRLQNLGLQYLNAIHETGMYFVVAYIIVGARNLFANNRLLEKEQHFFKYINFIHIPYASHNSHNKH